MRFLAATLTLALLAACTKPTDTSAPGSGPRNAAAAPKSRVIAKGTAYREADYKVPGKVVILDFYADW